MSESPTRCSKLLTVRDHEKSLMANAADDEIYVCIRLRLYECGAIYAITQLS